MFIFPNFLYTKPVQVYIGVADKDKDSCLLIVVKTIYSKSVAAHSSLGSPAKILSLKLVGSEGKSFGRPYNLRVKLSLIGPVP